MLRDRWFGGRKTGSFTLQWHLTNVCSAHCRHCYDRSPRPELSLPAALEVLADLQALCRQRRVQARLTFNRLAQVGEAADLELPAKSEFIEFLKQYLVAQRTNPVLGLKDNLFNIIRYHFRRPWFGGCTGYGCGAAFNFLALLPDGEVHA